MLDVGVCCIILLLARNTIVPIHVEGKSTSEDTDKNA